MFGNRRMPNGMSGKPRSLGHAVWEGAPCKGALYPIVPGMGDFYRVKVPMSRR